MARPLSIDLRERAVAAVLEGGRSRHRVAIWRRSQHGDQLGSAVPGDGQRGARPDGRPQTQGHCRRAPCLSRAADQGPGVLPARSCRRTFRARPQGRLSIGVELCSRREAQLQKKPSSPANGIALTSHGGARSGLSIKAGSSRSAWSSSMRPGRRRTWRRSGDGRRAEQGSWPKFRTAIGKP